VAAQDGGDGLHLGARDDAAGGVVGELRISSRVRGVMRASSSAGSKLKPRDSRRLMGTGTAPLTRICES